MAKDFPEFICVAALKNLEKTAYWQAEYMNWKIKKADSDNRNLLKYSKIDPTKPTKAAHNPKINTVYQAIA